MTTMPRSVYFSEVYARLRPGPRHDERDIGAAQGDEQCPLGAEVLVVGDPRGPASGSAPAGQIRPAAATTAREDWSRRRALRSGQPAADATDRLPGQSGRYVFRRRVASEACSQATKGRGCMSEPTDARPSSRVLRMSCPSLCATPFWRTGYASRWTPTRCS